MKKVISIHQPEHMPWSGFFHKMAQADEYVLLDNVQFKKNNWQNRNRIVSSTGEELWLTVPIKLKGHMQSTISDTEINEQNDWKRKYWGRLYNSYCNHLYYSQYAEKLQEILDVNHSQLRDLNKDLINFFRSELEIHTPMYWASDLDVEGKSTELLVSICKQLNATHYLSGPDGAKYLDCQKFADAGIEIIFHNYTPPIYQAKYYLPALSTLDILMNHGKTTRRIIGLS